MAPRHILVPLDGSRFAEQALPHAAHVARCNGAHLHLVSVLHTPPVVVPPPLTAMAWVPPPAPVGSAANLPDQIDERKSTLNGVAARVRHEFGCDVSVDVVTGDVVEQLAAQVATHQVDLVVMTTHAAGGLTRLLLGSTADALVRRIDVPVLLVKPSDEMRPADPTFRRVLVPLDGSPFAERILDVVTATLECDHPEVTLLHVTELRSVAALATLAEPDAIADRHVHEDQGNASSYLTGQAERLRAAGWPAVIAARIEGTVARAIVDRAEQERADVIAIATHGRGGLRRFLAGSVTDKVIQDTRTRILVAAADVHAS